MEQGFLAGLNVDQLGEVQQRELIVNKWEFGIELEFDL